LKDARRDVIFLFVILLEAFQRHAGGDNVRLTKVVL
jgi:hypothetical protein